MNRHRNHWGDVEDKNTPSQLWKLIVKNICDSLLHMAIKAQVVRAKIWKFDLRNINGFCVSVNTISEVKR